MHVQLRDALTTDPQGRQRHPGHGGLPAPLTQLIGRDDALAASTDLVATFRLVTLTGPGGIGKTQLALAIAQRLVDHFPDGIAVVELAPVSDHDLVVPTIATVLGLWDTAVEPLEQRLTAHLRDRCLLLVLDNTEHLLDAAPTIAALLAACPHLHVLVTSRSPLHLHGEHMVDVPPLATPPSGLRLSADEAARYAAIALFVAHAQATDATFALTEANAGTIAAICTRLAGLPLAIELAAARSRVLSPSGILDRLDQQLQLLTGGPRDQPPRLQTMRGALDWSYDLLDAGQQAFFRRLAVFSGGWTLDAADAVCQPDEAVLDAMSSLIASSLVRRTSRQTEDDRFVLLEPIRQFAHGQLVASGELDALRSRHARFFLALAEEAAPHLDWRDQPVWMHRLDLEHDNIRAALAWLFASNETERGLRLVSALSWFWNIRGFYVEAWTQTQAFLRLPQAGEPTAARGRALAASAHALYFLGDLERAQSLGKQALSINERTQDRAGRARILIPLLMIAEAIGDDERHLSLSTELLTTARSRGDQENVARALSQLGGGALRNGDTRKEIALYTESLKLARRLENRATTAMALGLLGDVRVRVGNLDHADACYRECLSIYADLRFAVFVAVGLERLAAVACARKQLQRAARMYAAATAQCDVLGIAFPASQLNVAGSDITAIRAGLGDEGFQAAWDSVTSMSVEDTVAYALEPAPSPKTAQPNVAGKLSPRELDVLRLIAAGQSNKEIAADLFLSVRTVERHITNIYAKIDARGKADATAWALRHGIV